MVNILLWLTIPVTIIANRYRYIGAETALVVLLVGWFLSLINRTLFPEPSRIAQGAKYGDYTDAKSWDEWDAEEREKRKERDRLQGEADELVKQLQKRCCQIIEVEPNSDNRYLDVFKLEECLDLLGQSDPAFALDFTRVTTLYEQGVIHATDNTLDPNPVAEMRLRIARQQLTDAEAILDKWYNTAGKWERFTLASKAL
jgi:hypothetical protein